MNSPRSYHIYLIAITVLIVLLLRAWRPRGQDPAEPTIDPLRDTVTLWDTVTIVLPDVTTKYVRDSIYFPVRDTVIIHDTCYVALPREVKIYEADTYRAEVSGYQPALDRIDIYAQTQVVIQDRVQPTPKNSLSLGVDLNYSGSLRMPVQLEYSRHINTWLTVSAYAEYEPFVRQLGIGATTKVGIEW